MRLCKGRSARRTSAAKSACCFLGSISNPMALRFWRFEESSLLKGAGVHCRRCWRGVLCTFLTWRTDYLFPRLLSALCKYRNTAIYPLPKIAIRRKNRFNALTCVVQSGPTKNEYRDIHELATGLCDFMGNMGKSGARHLTRRLEVNEDHQHWSLVHEILQSTGVDSSTHDERDPRRKSTLGRGLEFLVLYNCTRDLRELLARLRKSIYIWYFPRFHLEHLGSLLRLLGVSSTFTYTWPVLKS
jgi:hypothetical protein